MLKPNPVKIAPHFKIEPPYLSKKPESLSIKLGLGGSGLLPKYPSYSIGFVGAKYGVLPPPHAVWLVHKRIVVHWKTIVVKVVVHINNSHTFLRILTLSAIFVVNFKILSGNIKIC